MSMLLLVVVVVPTDMIGVISRTFAFVFCFCLFFFVWFRTQIGCIIVAMFRLQRRSRSCSSFV